MKIALIHFSPLEQYPPVMNWLNYISGELGEDDEVRVYSMTASEKFKPFEAGSSHIKIFRLNDLHGKGRLVRTFSYFTFYFSVLNKLKAWRPDTVMYYETLSAFPAVYYKLHVNKTSRIFIHYHEYSSPRDYREGMVISRWGHQYEKRVYPLAAWVSHTNEERLSFFIRDHTGIPITHPRTMPNYPPRSWERMAMKDTLTRPVKFVFVGSLSLAGMYTEAFARWIQAQDGQATWDIYSDNISSEARSFLEKTHLKWIRFHGAVNYFSLPESLHQYDVGVVLYNGEVQNFTYGTPNKLFEYWACGLDAWFSSKIKSSLPFVRTNSYPKILALDFDRLDGYQLEELTDRTGLPYKPSVYYNDLEYGRLLTEIKRA